MAFFTVKHDAEAIADRQGSGEFLDSMSGVFDVIVKHVVVSQSEKGAISIDLIVDYNGTSQTIYRAFSITNSNEKGNSVNEIGQRDFNKFLVVMGLDAGKVLNDPIAIELPIGKKGTTKTCMVLEELSNDTPITINLKQEYSMYNGDIRKRSSLKGVYRTSDHATAAEIVNQVEPGKQFERDSKFFGKNIYKDGITEEAAKAWEEAKKNSTSTSSTPAQTPGSRFGSRFGNQPF